MKITRRIELPLLLKYFGLPMVMCEVGVNGGNSSTDFLKQGIDFIYCVDAWRTLDQVGDGGYPQEFHDECYKMCLDNLAPFKGKYEILKGLSKDMCNFIPDKSLGMCYIDSDHSYKGVKEDIWNYLPKLVDGGLFGFHDYPNYEGVVQAVTEFAKSKNLVIFDIPEDCMQNAGCWIKIG